MTKSSILPSYHPIVSFEEVSDHYLTTKKLRVLSATFCVFLISLWVVAKFSGTELYIHNLRYHNRNSEAAMAAASVLGGEGEEGIHGLEVERHGRIGGHGIHESYFYFSGHRHSNVAQQRFEEALLKELQFDDIYYDSEPSTKIELEIDDLVNDNPVVVFSKSYCPYSRRAKHILSLYQISPSILIIEVDQRDDSNEVKQALTKSTYRNTFPNIFVDGKSIGGSDELNIMHSSGRLYEILDEAGVIGQNRRPAL